MRENGHYNVVWGLTTAYLYRRVSGVHLSALTTSHNLPILNLGQPKSRSSPHQLAHQHLDRRTRSRWARTMLQNAVSTPSNHEIRNGRERLIICTLRNGAPRQETFTCR